MRLRRHMTDLLTERNVMTIEELEEQLHELGNHCRGRNNSEKAIKWINTTLRKWLINDYDDSYDVRLVRRLPASAPSWAQAAFKRGEDIWSVLLNPTGMDRFRHILDWLLQADVRDVTRVSVPEAIRQTELWDEARKKRKLEMKGGTYDVVMDSLPGGMKLVRLTDDEALRWEGSHMGHCVGDYAVSFYAKRNNRSGLYSIRDRKGMPHVTIEVVDKTIKQIKGKENKFPKPRYMDAVAEAIQQHFRGFDIKEPGIMNLSDGRVATLESLKAGDKCAAPMELSGSGTGITDYVFPGGIQAPSIAISRFGSLKMAPGTKTNRLSLHGYDLAADGVKVRNEMYVAQFQRARFKNLEVGATMSITQPEHSAYTSLERCKVDELQYMSRSIDTMLVLDRCEIRDVSGTAAKIDFNSKIDMCSMNTFESIKLGPATSIKRMSLEWSQFKKENHKIEGAIKYAGIRFCGIDYLDLTKAKVGLLDIGNSTLTGAELRLGSVGTIRFDLDVELKEIRIHSGTIGTLSLGKTRYDNAVVIVGKGAKVKKVVAPEGAVIFE